MLFNTLVSKRRRKQAEQEICLKAKCVPQHQKVEECPAPPPKVHPLVKCVDMNVGKLLCTDSLDWKKKDREFAVFRRSEICTGRQLGSGGFSDVYEIESFSCSQEQDFNFQQTLVRETIASEPHMYAIKHLRPKFLEHAGKMAVAGADLVVEAQFLSSLRHPNILPVHGWSAGGTEAFADGSNDGYFLIVEKLHDTLEQRIKRWGREGISNSDLYYECARIGAQIASALEYLHSKDVIFRDLKPNNIGFDANDDIKIFDFGLCRKLPTGGSFNDTFKMSGRVGTVRYMSPECATNKEYGISSDVYSLSMVLYEMINRGVKPYANFSDDDHNTKACIGGERPPMDESWPIMMQDLLERTWSADSAERPTMAEIGNRLQDLMMDLLEESFNFSGDECDKSVVLEFPIGFSSSKPTYQAMDTRTASLSEGFSGGYPSLISS